MNLNTAASVRERLLKVAKAQGVIFDQVLVRFALERILRKTLAPAVQHSGDPTPTEPIKFEK